MSDFLQDLMKKDIVYLSEEEKIQILETKDLQENMNKDVYNKIIQIISSLSSKENKLEYMNKYIQNEVGKAQVISTLDNDEEKTAAMDQYITAEYAKVDVILSLSNDRAKIIAMDQYITNLRGITNIIESLESDNNKVMAMERYISDERLKAYVVKSIKDDEYKMQVMEQFIQSQENINLIVESINDDDRKILALEQYILKAKDVQIVENVEMNGKEIQQTELYTTFENVPEDIIQNVILTLQSDDKKLQAMSKYIKDYKIRTNIICSLQSDDLKIDVLNRHITQDDSRIAIIKSMISEEKKLSIMEQTVLIDDKRIEVLKSLPENRQLELMNTYISSEEMRLKLIKNLREEYKFEAVEKYLENEESKVIVINSLKNEKKRVEALEYIMEEENKTQIIASLKSDDLKIQLIDEIQDKQLANVIASSMNDKENVKKYMNMPQCTYTNIGLPSNMTIGMEVECEGKYSSVMHNVKIALTTDTNDDWVTHIDETLKEGVEIVSPILTDNKDDVEDIYLVCNKLTNLGQEVSQRCGGHVHIGADYLTSKEAYANLYEIWGNAEEIIFKMCNEKGDLPRQGFQSYATAVASKVNDAIEKGSIDIESEEDLNAFIDSLQQVQGERYASLNINNVNSNKNTIEFRISNGTINPDTWIENIRLYGRIIEVSEKIANLEKKEELTKDEEKIIELKDKLKENIPEVEKMEVILDMLFQEEEKDVYRQRYDETIRSINENPENKKLFTSENIVVDFKKKKRKNEFKDVAIKEKDSDIIKVEQDFVAEIERGLEQEVDIER